MSEEHQDHDDDPMKKARELNRLNPLMLNCTKVVRLFVIDRNNGRSKADIMANENPTRADVFVDVGDGGTVSSRAASKSGGDLLPESIGLRDVVPHDQAHREHPGSIVIVNGSDGEQIEWQCDVTFRVVNITMAEDQHTHGFVTEGDPPRHPFAKSLKELKELEGDRCTPIRSGAISREKKGPWKQLYKVHFELKIGGKWKPLDPDVYGTCGAP